LLDKADKLCHDIATQRDDQFSTYPGLAALEITGLRTKMTLSFPRSSLNIRKGDYILR
jgi:hypothetical protein